MSDAVKTAIVANLKYLLSIGKVELARELYERFGGSLELPPTLLARLGVDKTN